MNSLKNQEEIRDLIVAFFKDSKITQKEGVLTINNAPKDFEDIFGKKAPYRLVFDVEKHEQIEGSELILRGSYFLSTIKECMQDKGQTSLLKLELKLPSSNVLDQLSFPEHNLVQVKNRKVYAYLPRFLFFSNCQSLNEKNHFSKEVLLKNYKPIELDTSKLKFSSADKKELENLDLSKDYDVAKKDFKNFIDATTKDIKTSLRKKLRVQLDRINEYYHHQIKEKDDEMQRCRDKIIAFERELKHTFYQRDADTLRRNIRDTTARLELLRKQGYKQRLQIEKDFHIKDETDKHALLIENSLVNVTLVYYNAIFFDLVLEKKKSRDLENIQIYYDPLFNEFDLNNPLYNSGNKKIKIKIKTKN